MLAFSFLFLLLCPFSLHLAFSVPFSCAAQGLPSVHLAAFSFHAFPSFSFLAFSFPLTPVFPSSPLSFYSFLLFFIPLLFPSLLPSFASPLPPTHFNEKGERLVVGPRILRYRSLSSLCLALLGPLGWQPLVRPGLCHFREQYSNFVDSDLRNYLYNFYFFSFAFLVLFYFHFLRKDLGDML